MTDNAAKNKTQREMLMDLTVSAGIQGNKLDNVIATLKQHCENEEAWRAGFSKRLRNVEELQGRQDERIKHTARNMTGVNAVISAAMAAIAGYIGIKS